MKKTLLCFLSFLLLVSTSAQTRRRPTATPPSTTPASARRKLVETVKTQDGREIHLYDDMTYDVAASVAPTAPTAPTMVSINVKAGVITNAGDVKPVARRDFIIFREDIKPALATVSDREGKALDVFSFYLADEYRELDEGRTYTAALDKLKSFTVTTFTTDFQGNATVQIPSSDGTYWIYGSSQKVGRSSCMWYLQVTPNKNVSLVLDNNNAAYCG